MASGNASGERRTGDASCGLGLEGIRTAELAGHTKPSLLLRVWFITVLLEAYNHVEHNRAVSRFDRHFDPPPPGRLRHVANGGFHRLLAVGNARSDQRTNDLFARERYI